MEIEQDLRLREVQVNVEQNGGGEGGVPRSNCGHSVARKALKLPLFNDEKDDLDAYLNRFERACTAFEIRPEFWSTQLARLLQGRSMDVYQRLPAEEVDNYESLKTQLLKRFRLTEGGYRKKFKMSKPEVGETPEQFVERLNRYIVKWCEMAGYEDNYDGLKSLVIRDQFFITCDGRMIINWFSTQTRRGRPLISCKSAVYNHKIGLCIREPRRRQRVEMIYSDLVGYSCRPTKEHRSVFTKWGYIKLLLTFK